MRPGLTLLCITKDQAPKLMRLLKSVQGVVDDIVVFDTGSKDLSPGIAKLHGARVFEIEWPGSFSEALNRAMKEVQTEWTLRLDTDEWLPPESGSQLRRIMDERGAFGYFLIRQDRSDDMHSSESWHLRMWRSDPRLRYTGYIHEHFTDEDLVRASNGRKVFRAQIRFLHDGYEGGMSEEKHRRNMALLQEELAVRPGQLYYEVELALTRLLLKEQGSYDQARALALRILDAFPGDRPDPFVANLFGHVLVQTNRVDLGTAEIQRLIDKSWEWFDACPPLLWSIAQAELRRNRPEAAYRSLLRLEQLGSTNSYEREWSFDANILQEGLWDLLGRVARTLGHEEVAERNRARLEERLLEANLPVAPE